MKNFSKNGFVSKFFQLLQHIQQLNIPLHAAYAGYFIILSAFPALLLVLTLLLYTGLQVDALLEILESLLPGALMSAAESIINSTYRTASGAIAGVSAIAALWSASKGIYGLLTGLNAVYGVSEDRGYFYTRGISVLYALGFILVLLLTLVLHVFGGRLIMMLHSLNRPLLNFVIDILNLRFFLLMVLQIFVFTLMFMVLPNRRNSFASSLPGGLLSCIGWQLFSNLYSIYITYFSGYTSIYGSVYAIALSMLWLYFCLSILFYGGALNRYLLGKKQ